MTFEFVRRQFEGSPSTRIISKLYLIQAKGLLALDP